MSTSAGREIDRYYEKIQKAKERRKAEAKPLITCGIIDFCLTYLGFTPFPYQVRFLLDTSQFVVARWARQSGKSHAIAALALYLVLSQSYRRIVILAPSLRQSRRMIAKISFFLSKMDQNFLAGALSRPGWSSSTDPASKLFRTARRRSGVSPLTWYWWMKYRSS